MAILDIALTNLNQYVCGKLNFVWLSLPCTDEELAKAFDEIEVSHDGKHYYYCGNESEEYFITDWESDVFKNVGEYSHLPTLRKQAEKVKDLNEEQLEIVSVLLGESYDLDEAIEELENVYIFNDCENMAQVAMDYTEQYGIIQQIPEDLREFFDYEAYGNMLETTGSWYPIKNGYLGLCV